MPDQSHAGLPRWKPQRYHILLILILLLALSLRLGYVLSVPPVSDTLHGGDYSWYAREGRTLIRTGWTYGPLPTGPVFLLVAGYAEELGSLGQHDLPGWLLQRMIAGRLLFPHPVGPGQPAIRLLHALLGTLTVWMVARIGRAAWDARAGLVAAFLVAINPLFILETANTTTETIAIFLLAWAVALWMERVERAPWRLSAETGALLAVAALTRSVFLAYPALFVVHLGLKHGWRRMLKGGLVMLLAFLLTVSPWTLYNLVTWDRLTLAGEGLLDMLYVGAVGWKAPAEVDAELGVAPGQSDYATRQEAFAEGLTATVFSDPLSYLAQRGRELGGALLQPHNTTVFAGESIKQLAQDWLRHDRTPGGLVALTRADYFWPKLSLYVAHFAALLLGVIGLVTSRRRWRDLLPLYGTLAYFLGIHLFLSAIPRYLFPLELFWWLFGARALTRHDQRRMAADPAPGLQ